MFKLFLYFVGLLVKKNKHKIWFKSEKFWLGHYQGNLPSKVNLQKSNFNCTNIDLSSFLASVFKLEREIPSNLTEFCNSS